MVKFAYFCIIDSLVVLQMVKLIILKMLYKDEQKQKQTEANKRYRDNMSDERKQN